MPIQMTEEVEEDVVVGEPVHGMPSWDLSNHRLGYEVLTKANQE